MKHDSIGPQHKLEVSNRGDDLQPYRLRETVICESNCTSPTDPSLDTINIFEDHAAS